MAISIGTQTNIDKSNLAAYPNGQILDNTGPGTGTPITRVTSSDIWMFFDKIMRMNNSAFNAEFDNEINGYQFVQAAQALASKSDFIIALTTAASVLHIATKLGILQLNEKLIVQAAADWTSEAHIIGSDAVNLTVTITRQYKAGDYLMLRKTSSGGVTLISLITADNLSAVLQELGYLQAASNGTELAGIAVNVATTPASNLSAFTLRVTDPTDAAPFLATDSTPGLMSAADKTALDGFSSPIKNVGWFSGVNPGFGTVGAFAPVAGDIASAQITIVDAPNYPFDGTTFYEVTFNNAMADLNYYVRTTVSSEGNFSDDVHCAQAVCQILTTTTFQWGMIGIKAGVKNLKIYLEVVQSAV